MDFSFALGLAAGFLLWPWWALSLFALVCFVDIVCLECEAEGWGTGILIIGVAALAWLAADVNVFMWVWHNLANIAKFFLAYFLAGSLWCVAKWYFYMLKVRDKVVADKDGKKIRPYGTYAKQNKARITSWIGHWPLSMIGFFFGDFLKRIGINLYRAISGLLDRISNSVFADFEEDESTKSRW